MLNVICDRNPKLTFAFLLLLTFEIIKNEYLREGQSYSKECPHTGEVNEQKMFEVETRSYLDWIDVQLVQQDEKLLSRTVGKSQFHLSSGTIDKLQSSKQTLETF